MMLEEILEKIQQTKLENTFLYFVTRVLKPDTKKSSKVLNKYNFKAYQVDINDEIREHLNRLAQEQIVKVIEKKIHLRDYDVITDDIQSLFTYQMTNKALSFSDVIDNQLKKRPPAIIDMKAVLQTEELWAYCIGFSKTSKDWIYTFRKVMAGRVAMDETDNHKNSFRISKLRTYFNTKSNKLELVEGQTITLDKQVDCIFYNDTFYIPQKTQFEQIVGIEEEFLEEAIKVVSTLKASGLVNGIEHFSNKIEKNPAIHRKLARLSKLGHCNSLNKKCIKNMQQLAMQFGENLKLKDGKLHIEDDADIDLAIRMLSEYYKKGEVFGNYYGTYSGKVLKAKV